MPDSFAEIASRGCRGTSTSDHCGAQPRTDTADSYDSDFEENIPESVRLENSESERSVSADGTSHSMTASREQRGHGVPKLEGRG